MMKRIFNYKCCSITENVSLDSILKEGEWCSIELSCEYPKFTMGTQVKIADIFDALKRMEYKAKVFIDEYGNSWDFCRAKLESMGFE